MNVQPGDRARGIRALQYWYDASGIGSAGVSFDQAVKHYDDLQLQVIENIGGALRDDPRMTGTRIQTAMEDLARASGPRFPKYPNFFDAIIGQESTFGFDDVQAVAVASVQEVKTVAEVGLGAYGLFIGLGVLLFFWEMGKGARA